MAVHGGIVKHQMRWGDGATTAQHHCALHHVFEFTHIAWPWVVLQHHLGFRRDRERHTAFDMTRQRLRHQRHDVTGTVFQRLNAQTESADAEIQVFAEFALLDGLFQIFVGGCNHAHIQIDGGFTTQTVEFFLLQHAQQFGLQVHWHFTNLVQENGATVGLFK